MIGVGAVATAAGGAATAAAGDKNGLSGSHNVEDVGIGILVGGGVFVVGGLVVQALTRGVVRDGATTRFTLPTSAAPAQPVASGPPALIRF